MTIFKEISHFNELIGNAKSMSSAEALRVQLAMIKEEFEELSEALEIYIQSEGSYLTDVRDGIADVLVTTYGLAHRIGIDADADLRAVQDSNMSKFIRGGIDRANREAREISDRLTINTIASETQPGLWAITSASDQVGYDGKDYPKGKLLKPASYQQPQFP